MKRLEVLTPENAPEKSKAIFAELKSKYGMLPNIYAVAGHSPQGLEGNLAYQGKLAEGVFSNEEIQTIYLAASEANRCGYCLSAHTSALKMAGKSDEEIKELRRGQSDNEKLQILSQLTQAIVHTRGLPDEHLVDAFFDAGYPKAALVEMLGLVAVKTFTNYLNHLSGTPIDFPEVEPAGDYELV